MAEHHHNASPMPGMVPNSDPALDTAHEHVHKHVHHSEFAEKGRTDEIVYSKGTTDEPQTVPDADSQDDYLRRRAHNKEKDIEAGEVEDTVDKNSLSPRTSEDPQNHHFAKFYSHYKVVFHVFLAMLFTG